MGVQRGEQVYEGTADAMLLSSLDRTLLDSFQHDFPLSPAPYAELAQQLGVTEQAVIEALCRLTALGAVSRVGAVFAPRCIGASTLAAMAVPDGISIEAVARIVSAHVAVNHNYERLHDYNLWFVVTAPNEEQLEATLKLIEHETGIEVISLPMLADFHIDLGFDLQWD